jgi:hypothetical protein
MWSRSHGWQNRAMNDLTARLVALAATGQTITYGALARDLGLRMAELTAMLEAEMAADHAAGRPLLAAVCAGRLNNGQPAEGFFIKALELGLDVTDRAGLVQCQRAALHALYRGATSGA